MENFIKCGMLSCFQYIKCSIFDGAWHHTKLPFNFLETGNSYSLNFIFFGYLNAIGEWIAPCVICIISFENVPIRVFNSQLSGCWNQLKNSHIY